MLTEIAQYGAVALSLGVIFYMLREFLKSSRQQRDAFLEVIENHIKHNSKAIRDDAKAQRELRETVKELITWLKSQNGHK